MPDEETRYGFTKTHIHAYLYGGKPGIVHVIDEGAWYRGARLALCGVEIHTTFVPSDGQAVCSRCADRGIMPV